MPLDNSQAVGAQSQHIIARPIATFQEYYQRRRASGASHKSQNRG